MSAEHFENAIWQCDFVQQFYGLLFIIMHLIFFLIQSNTKYNTCSVYLNVNNCVSDKKEVTNAEY